MQYARFTSATTSAAVALALAAASLTDAPAVAQNSLVPSAPPVVPSPTNATVHLERAKSHAILGQFDEAREEYAHAAEIMRAEGVLPTDPLWQIAQIHFARQNHRGAAEVLSQLAREAEVMGDPVVQARALLEASVLYHYAGMTEAMLRSARRLQQLKASPYLPDELRAAIDSRVNLS
jgi:tetratricopeptide (TPR) repeat protein